MRFIQQKEKRRSRAESSGSCGALLSCFGKKEGKEADIGEALTAVCSRTRAALPYAPLPARTGDSTQNVSDLFLSFFDYIRR